MSDLFGFAGLLIMCVGIALLSVPWALIVFGAALFALGIAGEVRRSQARQAALRRTAKDNW